ncbi:hypothetical protein LguiA_017933 [Lonicera macranthoides]
MFVVVVLKGIFFSSNTRVSSIPKTTKSRNKNHHPRHYFDTLKYITPSRQLFVKPLLFGSIKKLMVLPERHAYQNQ